MIKNSSLQATLNNSINFSGISLHKGIVSNLIIKPAEGRYWYYFQKN